MDTWNTVRSGGKVGWEQAGAAGRSTSASWHPLLSAPQSPLVGLLARHINKTFNFRKFSSLGLLTLLMKVAQNTEALNIS